ncbi:flippase [Robertmurraya korlensis]|uniref:flippase n=1 Tax=Robertmurraya korlensis TaxID=519977 RepID=UPI00204259DB|nr:flippase [Robertmurraya korlensis]MCM3602201.1 flippase [Robertmurraya korlensis]
MTINKSVKGNFIWNLARILLTIIFPLISFPYVSRILGTDGLGKVNYISSVSAFFVMFALLGIPTYAIREGAKIRDEKEKLGKFATEILLIGIISSTIALIAYISLFYFPEFTNYRELLIVFGFSIPFSIIGVSWLYQIVEDYKRITLQSIIFQVLSLIMLFIFVRDRGDFIQYGLITVFSSVGSNILYLIHARKYVKFFGYKKYNFKRHLKPILIIFGMSVASSMYLNFDITMLGFMKDETSVGLYSAAVKINRLVIVLISSLSTVILARLTYYIQNNNKDGFEKLLYKTSNFILLLAIPATFGLYLLSEPLILMFSGNEFKDASLTMKILSVNVLFAPLNGLIAYQVFMPHNKEKFSLYAVLVGCVINLILNVIVIPVYAQNGAALTTVLAEISVFIMGLYLGRKLINIRRLFNGIQQFLLSSLSIIFIYTMVILITDNIFLHVILTTIFGCAIYLTTLKLFKNELVLELFQIIYRLFMKKSKQRIY